MYVKKENRGPSGRGNSTLLYGVPGIGKTSTIEAMFWDDLEPLILDVEGGAEFLSGEIQKVYQHQLLEAVDIFGAVQEIANADEDYSVIYIDSIDWVERRLQEMVCERHSKRSMGDFGYGAGDKYVATEMEAFVRALNGIRNRGIHIVLVAHEATVKVEPPDGQSYTRYQPALAKQNLPLLAEWCDHILFMHYERDVQYHDEGFGKRRAVASGSGERLFAAQERPAYMAKNRCGMPETFSGDDASQLMHYLSGGKTQDG